MGFQQPLFCIQWTEMGQTHTASAYEEAQRGYSEDMENVAYESMVQLFFEVLVVRSTWKQPAGQDRRRYPAGFLPQVRFEVGALPKQSFTNRTQRHECRRQCGGKSTQPANQRRAPAQFLGIQRASLLSIASAG